MNLLRLNASNLKKESLKNSLDLMMSPVGKLSAVIAKIAITATISTIREYERMKAQKQSDR